MQSAKAAYCSQYFMIKIVNGRSSGVVRVVQGDNSHTYFQNSVFPSTQCHLQHHIEKVTESHFLRFILLFCSSQNAACWEQFQTLCKMFTTIHQLLLYN